MFARHLGVAIVAAAALVRCTSPVSPSSVPTDVSGTWIATLYLLDCTSSARDCRTLMQTRETQRLLRLRQSGDGRVEAVLGYSENRPDLDRTLSGTYSDGVLYLSSRVERERCTESITEEWHNTFSPMRGRWLRNDPGCPPPFGVLRYTYEIRRLDFQP